MLACLAIIGAVVASCIPWTWTLKRMSRIWITRFAAYYLLMEGSLLGVQQVTTDSRGGMALPLFLLASVVLLGMSLGLGLALMPRSEMPVVRGFATLVINPVRSLPLLTTLFPAAVVAPILLPSWQEGARSGA